MTTPPSGNPGILFHRRRLLALVVVGLCASSSPANAAGPAALVKQRTEGLAFFDLGASDGVRVGDALSVGRGGRVVGTCVVRELASSHAACAGEDLLEGDWIRASEVGPPPPGATSTPPARLAPLPNPAEVEAAREGLLAARAPLIAHAAKGRIAPVFPRAARGPGRYQVALEQRVQAALSPARVFERPQVQVAMVEDRLLPGLTLVARGRVVGEVLKPRTARFLPPAGVSPLLEDLSARFQPASLPVVVQGGRFRPTAPGATSIDGALVGGRLFDDALEAGLFGGGIPDPVSLAPTFARGTISAYASGFARPLGDLYLGARARTSLLWRPDASLRLEAEAQGEVGYREWFQLAASARGGTTESGNPFASTAGLAGAQGAELDNVQIYASGGFWRLRSSVGYRYQAGGGFDVDEGSSYLSVLNALVDVIPGGIPAVVGPSPAARVATHHLNGQARYLVIDQLEVSAAAWASTRSGLAEPRLVLAPEVAAVGLVGARSRLRLGGQAELGSFPGRSVYGQSDLFFGGLWLAARATLREADAIVEPYRSVNLSWMSQWLLLDGLSLDSELYFATGLPGARLVSHEPVGILRASIAARAFF